MDLIWKAHFQSATTRKKSCKCKNMKYLSRYFNLKNPTCAKVICHGDLWNPNLQFKGSVKTKELGECDIIDFQTVHFGSPAIETVEKLEGVTKFSLKEQFGVPILAWASRVTCFIMSLG
ncbi:unnamed protein product [Allacma fusca]|uniref:CHK kinase-like domain-containing protein n=1 Tax=Allacma fusca TaxID=39272 RepID=A0A8J2KVW8_9HEXA|nr:unnamed protein product [Allacma fusca]